MMNQIITLKSGWKSPFPSIFFNWSFNQYQALIRAPLIHPLPTGDIRDLLPSQLDDLLGGFLLSEGCKSPCCRHHMCNGTSQVRHFSKWLPSREVTHISHLGKFGKSSTQNCLGRGYVSSHGGTLGGKWLAMDTLRAPHA